ncbi:DUF1036 domain-containing protein [Nostoc sp.]|uniref:DUF1036 domain-containing protein n=1 Tax=Nostoc sp. TaxID=1180 RepID=UPI002FF5BB55
MQLRSLVTVMSAGMISFISSALLATPADASLTVCNRAGSKAFVAISYVSGSDGSSWSKGWLQLNPGSCGVAFPGRVSNADIGVYAETFTGVVEAGDTRRCVIWVQVQPSWTIRNADDAARCKGKGREMKGFRVFRTSDSPDYTYEVFD